MPTVADRESRPVVWARILGLGPDVDAVPSDQCYRFATRADTAFGANLNWRPYLVAVPSELDTRLDPVTGEIEIGGLTLDLVDGSQTAALTSIFATRLRSKIGTLAATATAVAGTVDVGQVVGGAPAINEVIEIGRERMRVTAVALGGGAGGADRLTVTRGYYGSTAAAHRTVADRGDGEVRYRAGWLAGRDVELWLNFAGNADGQAQRIGSYVLDRIEFVDGATWRLTLRGVEAMLDREVGRFAWTGSAPNIFSERSGLGRVYDRSAFPRQDVGIALSTTRGRGDLPDADRPWDLQPDSLDGGYLRYGDVCIEYERVGAIWLGGVVAVLATEWGVAQSGLPTSDEPTLACREVFPADAALAHGRFRPIPNGGTATASDHPIDIFLCLALSTGLGANVGAGQTNYDVLPGPGWGAIPVARFDIPAWEDMKRRLAFCRMPNLVVGWDGSFNLLAWVTQHLLGPLGVAPVQGAAGTVRPVRVTEVFPGVTTTALGTTDTIPGSESWEWDWTQRVTAQTWTIDHQGPDSDEGYEIEWQYPEARVRYPGASRSATLEVEARGLTRATGGEVVVLERGEFFSRHFIEPPPRLLLAVNWHRLLLDVGEHVLLTYGGPPNPRTGVRGLTAEPFLIIGRRVMLQDVVGGGGGGVILTLFWVGLDQPTLGLWGPSAAVAATDPGAGVVVTVVENSFTDGTATGTIPADDTGGFQVGGAGVGDLVVLCDSDGALKNIGGGPVANTPRVTAVTATTITLSDVFRDGGGVEVTRALFDIIVFCGDAGAAIYPASAWTTHMQQHGAWVDEATATVGGTARTCQWGD